MSSSNIDPIAPRPVPHLEFESQRGLGCQTCRASAWASHQQFNERIEVNLIDVINSAEDGCQKCIIIREVVLGDSEFRPCNFEERQGTILSQSCEETLPSRIRIIIFPAGMQQSLYLSYFYIDHERRHNDMQVFTVSGSAKTPWEIIRSTASVRHTSLEAISTLKSWLDTCSLEHAQCETMPYSLPTRVLKVDDDTVSLYVSQEDEREPYMALSHCWGTNKHLRTTKSSLAEFTMAIPWHQLSKTFQDAIITTRMLGLRFIWIDSLCIVQDDNEDWSTESGRMSSIYEGAHLVIAASEAYDGRDGFLHERNASSKSREVVTGTNAEGSHYSIKCRHSIDHMRDTNALSKRAWAFQERVLATRYADFSRTEVVWHCNKETKCECRVGRSWRTLIGLRMPMTVVYDQAALCDKWAEAVRRFTERSLTFSEDCLPALSGIARKLSNTGAGPYLAGLWLDQIPRGLLWERPTAFSPRSSKYRPPTWSWASVEGKIDTIFWTSRLRPVVDFVAKVQEAHCLSTPSDPMGRVTAGHLIISGPVIEVLGCPLPHRRTNTKLEYWEFFASQTIFRSTPNDSLARLDQLYLGGRLGYMDVPVEGPVSLVLMLIGLQSATRSYAYALIFRKSHGQEDVYERVGLLPQLGRGPLLDMFFENEEVRTLRVV